MTTHPYLRSYLAGIAVPTAFLLVILTVFVAFGHLGGGAAILVFPMAVVPNAWGLWNMLYLFIRSRRRWPLGAHGALLPFLLAPSGFALTRLLDFQIPPPLATAFPVAFPAALVRYYLVWKHLVGFLNELLGVSA